jgi:subtilisin family serine protease
MELPAENYVLHPVAHVAVPREKRHAAAVAYLAGHPAVRRVACVYRIGRAHAIATDRAMVGFRAGARNGPRLLARFSATVIERHEDEFLVRLAPAHDPMEVCARLRALDEVEFAEPDFVTIGHHSPRRSPGRAGSAGSPYALAITRARQAWKVQSGIPQIRIAVIDEGVESRHPCLEAAVVDTYDATRDVRNQNPEPWDAHGTACAGLAAGNGRGRTGFKGIATGCSLMAARFGYTPTQSGQFVTKQWWVKRAVDWAWKNGADVLSNSWGGIPESTAITRALERARTRGRGRKGCVLVAAAGNNEVLGGKIDFPGTLPYVLTVAASNEYDEPKTTESRDGERWWGSSYGPEVDLAAPGVDIFTTDNVGPPGFTKSSYVPDFNGTSSATPIVAGAAALVLAANPDLNEAAVRKILCETAVEGRNDHMGWGRVDVLAAVRAARDLRKPAPGKTAPKSAAGKSRPAKTPRRAVGKRVAEKQHRRA